MITAVGRSAALVLVKRHKALGIQQQQQQFNALYGKTIRAWKSQRLRKQGEKTTAAGIDISRRSVPR